MRKCTYTRREKLIQSKLKDNESEEILKKLEDNKIGIGISKAHFGEYLQGYFEDIGGSVNDRASISIPLAYSLIDNHLNPKITEEYYTIPIASSGSIAIFDPSENSKLVVDPTDKVKSKLAVQKTLKLLDKENYGGYLKIITGGKVSQGLGTSTSDIVSSIRAVANFFHANLNNDCIAKIAVDTEEASDGIMYDYANLFITTKGKILDNYGVLYPKIEILGFKSDQKINGIDTLSIPSRQYTHEEKKKLHSLRFQAGNAFEKGDIKSIGRIATSSAQINQRFLEKPHLEEIIDLANRYGADGVIVAHSGTMMGLMFNPYRMPPTKNLSKILDTLESLGFSGFKRYLSE